jgi:hypothetical protein
VIIHLFEYQVLPGHAAEVAGFVRQSLEQPTPSSLVARCPGRRLSVDGPRYLVVSVWRDLDSFRVGTNASGVPRDLTPKAGLFRRRLSSHFRTVLIRGTQWCDARVLRLHRAFIAVDALEAWEGTVPDDLEMIAAKPGNLVALAGVVITDEETGPEVPILVLTAWRDWDSLLEATGGRLNRQIQGTELAGPMPHPLADHYELIQADTSGWSDLPA